jgi:hypothetical protein
VEDGVNDMSQLDLFDSMVSKFGIDHVFNLLGGAILGLGYLFLIIFQIGNLESLTAAKFYFLLENKLLIILLAILLTLFGAGVICVIKYAGIYFVTGLLVAGAHPFGVHNNLNRIGDETSYMDLARIFMTAFPVFIGSTPLVLYFLFKLFNWEAPWVVRISTSGPLFVLILGFISILILITFLFAAIESLKKQGLWPLKSNEWKTE